MLAQPSRRSVRMGVGVALAVAGLSAGCSLVFHVDATQCQSTSDCHARGALFANTACHLGTCVADVPVVDAGADAGPPGIDAGPPCAVSSDCPIPQGGHPEVTCSPDTHACVQLTTDECPLVLGDYRYSKQVPPIVVGAFATILPNGSPTGHPSYRNYQLAIDEFTSQAGIPAGPGNTLRTPVAVVCNDDPAHMDAAMKHLVNDVHVPGVVGALDSADLHVMFSRYGFATGPNLFVVNPFGADSTLTALLRGQQLWHMLGTPNDAAPAYRALLPRVESYMRNSLPWRLGPTSPMRVATVTARATVLTDLAGAVETQPITWNNGNAQFGQVRTASYDPETINDSTLNGTPLSAIDIGAAVNGLLAFKPHVVISFANDEYVSLLQTLDLRWSEVTTDPPPVYILSPYNAESTALRTWVGNDDQKRTRVVGINFASASDTRVLTAYQNRFRQAGNPPSSEGAENYYDAMYFLLDSLVAGLGTASHTGALTGTDLGGGMLRLISPAGTPYDMGPTDMGGVFTTLGSTNSTSIRLSGALGSPVFNTQTGARVGEGDVYCVTIHPPSDAGPPTTGFTPDVLRLSPSPDGGAPILAGDASCFPGL